MKIDAKSATPVYRQIVEGMQSAIAAGIYLSGERVPSTRSLAMELRVNPNTVQKAYEELVRVGVLESRRGLGKIVSVRGTNSAQKQSELSVKNTLLSGVELAKTANIPDKRIRELLNEILASVQRKARV